MCIRDRLIIGVEKHRQLIDDIIKKVVENWTIERISIIDRNIIRMAIYEMFFEKDIPLKVSVDEAIEIAKLLGQKEDTPKFAVSYTHLDVYKRQIQEIPFYRSSER